VESIKHPALFIEKKRKELGNVFKSKLAGHEVIILCGNEALQSYYDEELVTRAKPFSPIQKEVVGGGTLNVTPFLDGETHLCRKNLMLKLVDRNSMVQYVQTMNSIYEDKLRSWSAKPEVELYHETKLLATQFIFKIIAGVDAENFSKNAEKYTTCLENYIEGLHTKLAINLHSTSYGKALEARNAIMELFERQIKEYQKKINNNENVTFCFISNLIKNVIPTVPKDHPFDIGTQVRELLHLFLGTAFIAAPLLYAHLELPKHPEVIERLLKEITENKTSNGSLIDSVDTMKFLDNVVRELFRTYPYITVFPGTAKKDFVVQGFKVHEGALILAALYSTNHDEKIYKDPETFRPGRWDTPETERAKCPMNAFVTHGGGKVEQSHRCLGEEFSRYAVKLYLINWLSGYECTINKHEKIDLDWHHGISFPGHEAHLKAQFTKKK